MKLMAFIVATLISVGLLAAPADAVTATFASQTAGLTGTQRAGLQRDVTRYVRETGGRQVAANVVDFPGGSVTVAVPGERYARDLRTQAQPASSADCLSGDFCAWSGANYTGSRKAYYICQSVLPFAGGTGSIFNHQTGGAVTTFYLKPNPDGATAMYLAAGYGDASWNWAETKSVRTC